MRKKLPPTTETESLKIQMQSLNENWKRALADYQNLLRRVELEKKEFVKLSNANLVARLLPSLDIIDLAAAHSHDLGVQMAAKQFRQALSEEGLQLIEPQVNIPFDHTEQECSETLPPVKPEDENTVAELVLKGYKIDNYVLRPARVKVFKSSSTSAPIPVNSDIK